MVPGISPRLRHRELQYRCKEGRAMLQTEQLTILKCWHCLSQVVANPEWDSGD